MNYRIIAVRTYIDFTEPEDSGGIAYPLGFAYDVDDVKKLVRADMAKVIQEEINNWGYDEENEEDEEAIQKLRNSYDDDLDSVENLADFQTVGTLTKDDDDLILTIKYIVIAC